MSITFEKDQLGNHWILHDGKIKGCIYYKKNFNLYRFNTNSKFNYSADDLGKILRRMRQLGAGSNGNRFDFQDCGFSQYNIIIVGANRLDSYVGEIDASILKVVFSEYVNLGIKELEQIVKFLCDMNQYYNIDWKKVGF